MGRLKQHRAFDSVGATDAVVVPAAADRHHYCALSELSGVWEGAV
jgi:hypothetical protein